MIGCSKYDDAVLVIRQMIDNTTPTIVFDRFAARWLERHDEPTEEGEEEVTVVESCKQALAGFANLSDDERMETDPYAAVYERATVCTTLYCLAACISSLCHGMPPLLSSDIRIPVCLMHRCSVTLQLSHSVSANRSIFVAISNLRS
jgi:hypothetical protein